MKIRVRTLLGDLTVFTDQEDWKKVVEIMIDVAKELDLPLPRALYYGTSDYTKVLSPTDYKDVHLTYRGVSSTMEYWHRDNMILLFERLEDRPLNRVKALFAHELIHHSDNVNNLNITAYAIPCARFCNMGIGPVCVAYFKVCLDTLRNTSVNSRLPSIYKEICTTDSLEQVKEAMKDARKAREKGQRQLALLYAVILASSLILFAETKQDAADILRSATKDLPLFEKFSLFLQKSAEEIFGKKPSIATEESYIESFKPLLCSIMKHIFQQ